MPVLLLDRKIIFVESRQCSDSQGERERESMPSISLHCTGVHSTDEVLNSKGNIDFVLSSYWNGKADRGKLTQRILYCESLFKVTLVRSL